MDQTEIAKTVSCKYCKQSMPHGAKLCHVCKSYQDWRSLVGISNTTLALLIALLSAFSFSADRLASLVPKPRLSSLTVLPTDISTEFQIRGEAIRADDLRPFTHGDILDYIFHVSLFVRNSGNEPAVLRRGRLLGQENGFDFECKFFDPSTGKEYAPEIGAGESHFLKCTGSYGAITNPINAPPTTRSEMVWSARRLGAYRILHVCRFVLNAADPIQLFFEVATDFRNDQGGCISTSEGLGGSEMDAPQTD